MAELYGGMGPDGSPWVVGWVVGSGGGGRWSSSVVELWNSAQILQTPGAPVSYMCCLDHHLELLYMLRSVDKL